MGGEPVDTLLERLAAGDPAAADQVARAYGPYLRAVARRQLAPAARSGADPDDVVQSVWVQVLEGLRTRGWRFADEARLRAFLARLTRRRSVDHLRRRRRLLRHEGPLPWDDRAAALPAPGPRAEDVLVADELWERLLRLCPPAHREVLRLRREGVRAAEIAARTGLHEGSVRRILGALWRRLARDRG